KRLQESIMASATCQVCQRQANLRLATAPVRQNRPVWADTPRRTITPRLRLQKSRAPTRQHRSTPTPATHDTQVGADTHRESRHTPAPASRSSSLEEACAYAHPSR